MGGLRIDGSTYDERVRWRAKHEAEIRQLDEQALLTAFRQEPTDASTLRFLYDRAYRQVVLGISADGFGTAMTKEQAVEVFKGFRTMRYKYRVHELVELSRYHDPTSTA